GGVVQEGKPSGTRGQTLDCISTPLGPARGRLVRAGPSLRFPRVSRVGLQLWTIRDAVARDLPRALRPVGSQGFDGVDLCELHGHPVEVVRAWLDSANLVAAGRHVRLEVIESELGELAEELGVLGADRAAVSWVDPETLDRPDDVVERLADAARAA